MYIGLHLKCPLFLSDYNETQILLIIFEKYSNIKFNKNQSSCFTRSDRRTDVRKLIAAFAFKRTRQKCYNCWHKTMPVSVSSRIVTWCSVSATTATLQLIVLRWPLPLSQLTVSPPAASKQHHRQDKVINGTRYLHMWRNCDACSGCLSECENSCQCQSVIYGFQLRYP